MTTRSRSRTARSTASPATCGAPTASARPRSPDACASAWPSVNGGSFIGAHLPFGGRGQSGIGREWGVAGFEEFLELQSVGIGTVGQ